MQNSLPNNWAKIKFGDVATLHRGYDLPVEKMIHGSHPVVFSNGKIEYHNEYKIKGPGVITGRSGALGNTFYIEDNYWPHNTTLYISDFHGNNPKFIYYLLKTFNFSDLNAGTGVPTLNRNHVHELLVQYPTDINIQEKIAIILSSFDDKIELNNRISKTLEEMAQAIFKEWFVEFEFPIPLLRGTAAAGGWKINQADYPPRQASPATPQEGNYAFYPYWNLPKNKKLKERARELRKQGILSEVVFWKKFKDKKTLGWDIDRQVIIDNFIVDFFIPELGLIFEIDGASHDDKQEYDLERDAVLEELGLEVVRVLDRDVLKNIDGVWEFVNKKIKERVEELKSTPSGFACHPSRGELGYKSSGGKMIDSELGKIPEGWSVRQFGDIMHEVRRSIDPKYINADMPYLGIEHLPRRSLLLSEWGYAKDVVSTKLYFNKGDILFGKIRPYFHKVIVAPIDGVCSTDILVMKPAMNKYFGIALSYAFSDGFVNYASMSSQGTNMPRAKWEALIKYPIIIPDNETLNIFNQLVISSINKIENSIIENQKLAILRDLLLPKLMKGEIRV